MTLTNGINFLNMVYKIPFTHINSNLQCVNMFVCVNVCIQCMFVRSCVCECVFVCVNVHVSMCKYIVCVRKT